MGIKSKGNQSARYNIPICRSSNLLRRCWSKCCWITASLSIFDISINVQIGSTHRHLRSVEERHARRVAEDDGGVVDIGAASGVAVALAAHALLVDLVTTGVGLAGESGGGDGHGPGNLVEFILHECRPIPDASCGILYNCLRERIALLLQCSLMRVWIRSRCVPVQFSSNTCLFQGQTFVSIHKMLIL